MATLYFDYHTHDETGSNNGDATAKISNKIARLKELGVLAVGSTNHGNLVSTWDHINACKEAGLKFVPGIEFYVEDKDFKKNRRHLIVLAKSYKGWQAISKCTTDTAYNLCDGYPVATEEMLFRWFGEGSIGHGEVIATSACMQGVAATYLLRNFKIKKEEDKIRRKQGNKPDIDRYEYILNSIIKNDEEMTLRREERDKNKLKSGDKAVYEAAVERLNVLKKANKDLKTERDIMKPSVEKYRKAEEQIAEIQKKQVSEIKAKKDAKAELCKYRDIFGEGNFFVELQYHGIEEEAYAMPILADLAKSLHLPVSAANDSHMVTKEEAEIRQALWANKFSWKAIREEDRELYIKTNEELEEILLKILPKKVVEDAINNTKVMAEMCNVEFSAGTYYPKFPCKEGAKLHLRRLIAKGKAKVKPWTDEYQARLEHELRVIETMGFSDYLCIIEDFLNYGRLVGKCDLNSPEFLDHKFDLPYLKKLTKNKVGDGIGPGRGSAAGCLICYLVGITNIDPIANDLLFERFLNPERVSMPDIDSDVAPNVRPFVIEYIKHKYGEKAVCQILTRGFFGAKSSIQAGARVLGRKIIAAKTNKTIDDDEDGFVSDIESADEKMFLSLADKMSKSIDDATASISSVEPGIIEQFGNNKNALEILRFAKMFEGRCANYGTHAAGIIISDNGDVSDHLPLISVSGAIDCQCDLNYVEPLGMLKLDLLGLRNLGIITECEKAVQKNTGIKLSVDTIPDDPDVYKHIFSKGLTNGVFQFESDGMKSLLKNFGPNSISDLTLLNAIFRPGPLQYIDDVTAVKKGETEPQYIIPEMEEILGMTYGKPIYQEQIMKLMGLAGFSLGEADIIRRYMSKKKVDKFVAYKDKFIDGLVARGAKRSDAASFWDELVAFSEYAFNKSHSRAYSEVAYATAYLKYHYPEAYTVGLLNYTASDKREAVLTEAKNSGIKISVPDINIAEENFILSGKEVVYGLSSITQVAASAGLIVEERKKNGKFVSFTDFVNRCSLKKNVTENLIKAGAFDSLHESRQALLIAYPVIAKALETIEVKEQKLLTEVNDKKRIALKKTLEDAKYVLSTPLSEEYEDSLERLMAERDVLGYFISDHPISDAIKECIKLKDFDKPFGDVIVFINSVEFKKSKAGRPYARVLCEDNTGSLNCVVFERTLDNIKQVLKEGSILKLSVSRKEDSNIINKAVSYIGNGGTLEMPISSFKAFEANKEKFINYKGNLKLVLFLKNIGKFKETDVYVNKDILKSKFAYL